MDAVIQFILDEGGWGAWFLTICFVGFWILKGKLVHIRTHESRISDIKEHHKSRVKDYQNRLDAEIDENEWLRDALLTSTEMGAILSKSKLTLSGRRHTDEAK